jgi:hypothetical protein
MYFRCQVSGSQPGVCSGPGQGSSGDRAREARVARALCIRSDGASREPCSAGGIGGFDVSSAATYRAWGVAFCGREAATRLPGKTAVLVCALSDPIKLLQIGAFRAANGRGYAPILRMLRCVDKCDAVAILRGPRAWSRTSVSGGVIAGIWLLTEYGPGLYFRPLASAHCGRGVL